VIDVVRDSEGVREAIEAILEEDLHRARIQRESSGADPRTRDKMLAQLAPRTLSPGYFRFAEHLLRLDAERSAGIPFHPGDLASFEAEGLVTLCRARSAFEYRHPACGACGARQKNRFGIECNNCGTKFRRKGMK
jgi:hypothetical protein